MQATTISLRTRKGETSYSSLLSKTVILLLLILLEASLRTLIKKLKKQRTLKDPSDVQMSLDREKLRGILEDHGVDAEKSKDFVEALLVWKRQL